MSHQKSNAVDDRLGNPPDVRRIVARNVVVSQHRVNGSDGLKLSQNRRVANVARMNDAIALDKRRISARVKSPVSIGQNPDQRHIGILSFA